MKLVELFEEDFEERKKRYATNAKAKLKAFALAKKNGKQKAGDDLIDRVKKLHSYENMISLAKDVTSEDDRRKQKLYFSASFGKSPYAEKFDFVVSQNSAKFNRAPSWTFSTLKPESFYQQDSTVGDDHDLAAFDRSLQLAYGKLKWEREHSERDRSKDDEREPASR